MDRVEMLENKMDLFLLFSISLFPFLIYHIFHFYHFVSSGQGSIPSYIYYEIEIYNFNKILLIIAIFSFTSSIIRWNNDGVIQLVWTFIIGVGTVFILAVIPALFFNHPGYLVISLGSIPTVSSFVILVTFAIGSYFNQFIRELIDYNKNRKKIQSIS